MYALEGDRRGRNNSGRIYMPLALQPSIEGEEEEEEEIQPMLLQY